LSKRKHNIVYDIAYDIVHDIVYDVIYDIVYDIVYDIIYDMNAIDFMNVCGMHITSGKIRSRSMNGRFNRRILIRSPVICFPS